MRLMCLFGRHTWKGCLCSACRASRHRWNGCLCSTCQLTRAGEHDWNECICRRCGASREGNHATGDAGVCTRCGAGDWRGKRWVVLVTPADGTNALGQYSAFFRTRSGRRALFNAAMVAAPGALGYSKSDQKWLYRNPAIGGSLQWDYFASLGQRRSGVQACTAPSFEDLLARCVDDFDFSG